MWRGKKIGWKWIVPYSRLGITGQDDRVARTPAAGWRRCPIPLLYPDGETHLQSIHRIPEEEAYKYPTEPMWLSESPARRQKEMGYETLGAWRGYWWDVVTSERDPACLFFFDFTGWLAGEGEGRGTVLYCSSDEGRIISLYGEHGYGHAMQDGRVQEDRDSWSGQENRDRQLEWTAAAGQRQLEPTVVGEDPSKGESLLSYERPE